MEVDSVYYIFLFPIDALVSYFFVISNATEDIIFSISIVRCVCMTFNINQSSDRVDPLSGAVGHYDATLPTTDTATVAAVVGYVQVPLALSQVVLPFIVRKDKE